MMIRVCTLEYAYKVILYIYYESQYIYNIALMGARRVVLSTSTSQSTLQQYAYQLVCIHRYAYIHDVYYERSYSMHTHVRVCVVRSYRYYAYLFLQNQDLKYAYYDSQYLVILCIWHMHTIYELVVLASSRKLT